VYCYTFERIAVTVFVILLVSTSVHPSGTCTRITPAAQSKHHTHDRSVREVAAVYAVVTYKAAFRTSTEAGRIRLSDIPGRRKHFIIIFPTITIMYVGDHQHVQCTCVLCIVVMGVLLCLL
jgi:hypothetical protein